MKEKLFSKTLAVSIIVLFMGVGISPCVIGKEIPRLRTYNFFLFITDANPNNGSLSGYVNDTLMNPIQGARVRVSFHETYEEDYSDENGYYHVTNIPICYCLKNASCTKECYKTEWVLLAIVENTTYDFTLNTTNHPPNAPHITGPKSISSRSIKANIKNPANFPPGTHEFKFKATDPDGDDIRYHINWGDGSIYEITDFYPSGVEIKVSHTYDYKGKYTVRAKAEDTCGLNGPAGTMNIPIIKNKECGCDEDIKSDLIKVERFLNWVKVYSKLLLVLSRFNPELRELSEELSDKIATLKEKLTNNKDLIICDILFLYQEIIGFIGSKFYSVWEYFIENDNGLIVDFITDFIADFIRIFVDTFENRYGGWIWDYAYRLDCDWVPPWFTPQFIK